jgi:hypothetical protein
MTKFLIAAGILTVGTLVTDWARASDVACESWADSAYERSRCENVATREAGACSAESAAAWQASYGECVDHPAGVRSERERAEIAASLDVADYGCASAVSERDHELCGDAAYEAASEAVLAAPEWCEVTFVAQDVTHGWRAVCILVSESGE